MVNDLTVNEHPEAGEGLTLVSARITNIGALPVFETEMQLIAIAAFNYEYFLRNGKMGRLEPGESDTIEWLIPKYQPRVRGQPRPPEDAFPPDTHSVRLMVDFPRYIPEANEHNNFRVVQGLGQAAGQYHVESLDVSYVELENKKKQAELALKEARRAYDRTVAQVEKDYQELLQSMERLKSKEMEVKEADKKRAEASARTQGPAPENMDRGYASLSSQIQTNHTNFDAAVKTLDAIKDKQNTVGLSRADSDLRNATLAEIDRLQEQMPADQAALKALAEKLGYDQQIAKAEAEFQAQDEIYWALRKQANELRTDASLAEARALVADQIVRDALDAYNEAAESISALDAAGSAIIRAFQVINRQNETVFAAEVWAPDPEDLRELNSRIAITQEILAPLQKSHAELTKQWREAVGRMDLAGAELYLGVRNSGYAQLAVHGFYILLDIAEAGGKRGLPGVLMEVVKKRVEQEVFGEWKPEELKPNVYMDPSKPALGTLQKSAQKMPVSTVSKAIGAVLNQQFEKGALIRVLNESGMDLPKLEALRQQAKKLQRAQSELLKFKKNLASPRTWGKDLFKSFGKDLSKKYFTHEVTEFFERDAVQEFAAATAEMQAASQALVESLSTLKDAEEAHEVLASTKQKLLEGYDPAKHMVIHPGCPFSEGEELAILLLNERPENRKLAVSLGRKEAAAVSRVQQTLRYSIKAQSLNAEAKGPVQMRVAVSQ